jgi:hypothetical protein
MAHRPRTNHLIAFAMAILGVSGCGAGSKATSSVATGSTLASTQRPSLLAASHRSRNRAGEVALSSPAVVATAHGNELARSSTCDGTDTEPALRWHGIPSTAAELTVFVVNVDPITHKLFFDWAVAGLSPKLHGLPPAHLPGGAIVGRNGFGRPTTRSARRADRP